MTGEDLLLILMGELEMLPVEQWHVTLGPFDWEAAVQYLMLLERKFTILLTNMNRRRRELLELGLAVVVDLADQRLSDDGGHCGIGPTGSRRAMSAAAVLQHQFANVGLRGAVED